MSSVGEADVERARRRDDPAPAVETPCALIAGVEVWEKPRVVYREILSEAEYPLATRRWSRIEHLPEEEVRVVDDRDGRQHVEWLTRA